MDYIFGYGSIINDTSRIATATSCHSPSRTRGTGSVSESLGGEEGGGGRDLAVAASVCSTFAKRVWNFRCPTGFTALGIELNTDTIAGSLDTKDSKLNYESNNGASDYSDSTIDSQYDQVMDSNGLEREKCDVVGVLFPVPSHQDLTAFDVREVGYTRIAIPLHKIRMLPDFGCVAAQKRALSLQSGLAKARNDESNLRIWMYVPDPSHTSSPTVEYPILQTYVDVCIEGCLLWGGKVFAMRFLEGTSNWSEFFLNDTPMSRRPWLHRKEYKKVDDCLMAVSKLIKFDSRKHPDEFASLHLTSLKGMFGVPPRNRTFIGREDFIQSMHSRLLDGDPTAMIDSDDVLDNASGEGQSSIGLCSHDNSLKRVEVAGIGGVGKSQITIEYAHRYYNSSCYALVAWFRAESAASIATDMRKLAFELGIIKNTQNIVNERIDNEGTDTDKDLEEYDDKYIINELMRRLALCR